MKIAAYISASALIVTSALVSNPVFAEVFVAPFGGYSFGASEFNIKSAGLSNFAQDEEGELNVSESAHYGVMLGFTTNDPGDIYLIYSHQATELRSGGNFSPTPITDLDLDLDYLHLGGSLYFPNGNLKPYVTASVGLTSMRPGGDYSNETRFSMGFGAGAEYQLTESFSMFADARGYATFISSDSTLFCDGGECLWFISSDIMWQGQVNVGLKLRF
ncbi:outer membrane protein [Shewanella hanedai]|uniref:Porin family protein n=1 Tax=Shewanella hanedai TaxID=25 RepID=A0A553JLC7_SHEHA|nr:outer membrane beta-barrel protein [Shewanella hanedai]TRY13255.1 porin family protein [Shewanella hanedai]GGI88633.1 outer membrane protein [Shewanella hanedai]